MTGLLYVLFFCSGLSGLIYQVIWVRMFGNVFGNTIHSASLVVAIVMLGLGAGSYVFGAWADRRYGSRPDTLVRAYGHFELIIAAMGLGIALVLPHLGQLSALISSYAREASGWHVLSAGSYLARAGIALILLTPITLLMGGTLTLLIRHLVRSDLDVSGWRIAVLYAVNTAGAALGAILTDFALIPSSGLFGAQMVAVFLNVLAGVGALLLTVRLKPDTTTVGKRRQKNVRSVRLQPDREKDVRSVRLQADREKDVRSVRLQADREPDRENELADLSTPQPARPVILTAIALAMTGIAAMGMEILWFRHFLILLGGFRAVFSLLLAVILTGIGTGSLAGGFLHRRIGRPAECFMVVQALLVVSTLIGFAMADVRAVDAAAGAAERALAGSPGLIGTLQELWFNARPMFVEVTVPALLMGFSFPLANAIIQRAEQSVGRRAGVLYLANTAGAVVGSLATGFILLPSLGLQQSATILMAIATLAVVPLYFAVTGRLKPAPTSELKPAPTSELKPAPTSELKPAPTSGLKPAPTSDGVAPNAEVEFAIARLAPPSAPTSDGVAPNAEVGAGFSRPSRALIGSLVVGVGSLGLWLLLPSDYVIARALGLPKGNERVLTIDDGLTEVIAVTEVPGGRTLVTNGHAMSATLPLSQRYMRSLVHIPLLSMDSPETVLVIGFGVGNSTQSATLHPTVTRVDLADLSRDILAHASYFADNRDVLRNPKLTVYINDGRQHLQMQPPASYDLITLEPPPIAYAGVGALYSREFYELARTRLKPRGYISQWLPAYQVPPETTLAMVRAFIDVFPEAVLLSGAESDLILLGTTDARIEIDPVTVALAMAMAPGVRTDLERIDLGTPREIVGTFVGSSRTLAEATRDVAPVTDDRPMQEYGVRSMLNFFKGVPASVVDLGDVARWCPRCFLNGAPVPAVQGLDTYLELLSLAYAASPADVAEAKRLAYTEGRLIAGSAYLGEIVPETAAVHNVLGIELASRGRIDEAIVEFRRALALAPDDPATLWHLGAALASTGGDEEALVHLRRSAELDPTNTQARNDLEVMLQRQQDRP